MHTSLSCCSFIRAEFCHHINFEAYKCFNHLTRKHSCAAWIFSYISCRLFFFFSPQNIAWVKSYNICFELEDSNEIFTQLYRTLFQVIKWVPIYKSQPTTSVFMVYCMWVCAQIFIFSNSFLNFFFFCLPAVLTALSCCDSNIWKLSLLLHRKNAQ